MTKVKFKFNDKTLEYEKVELSWKDRLKKMGVHFGFSIVLSLVIIVLSFPIVEQIIARKQLSENQKLRREYNFMSTKIDELENHLNVLVVRDDSVYANIFGVPPISKNLRISGTGGSDDFEYLRGFSNSKLMIEVAKKLSSLESKIKVHQKGFERIEKLASTRSAQLDHIPAIQPIHNHNLIRTASGFGMRMHPVYKVLKMHTGVDFTAKVGTQIFATGDGVVKNAIHGYSGYGNHVVIDHGFGYESLYAHLYTIEVKNGQKLKRGDVIGAVGNTGTSTAPHLHYEVILNGRKVNPANYFFNDLSFDEYQEMIEISESIETSMD